MDSYIKLIYLRSRWYDPASGRFPTRDSWQGDYNRPLSLNRWLYGNGNPVMYVDPTGHYNRQAAVTYAYQHDLGPALLEVKDIQGDQCTNFASSVLWAGGVRDQRTDPRDPANPRNPEYYKSMDYYKNGTHLKFDSDDYRSIQGLQPPYWNQDIMKDSPFGNYWFLYLQEWYKTDQFLDFLRTNSLAEFISYSGVVPQFNNTLPTSENVNRNNPQWKEFLKANKAFIQPGDLVFYKWSSGSAFDWDHVAVVTDWSVQTYMDISGNDPWERIAEQLYYSDIALYLGCPFDWDMVKPRVVEQSGSIHYDTFVGGRWTSNRSVDNTHTQVASIMFAHIR